MSRTYKSRLKNEAAKFRIELDALKARQAEEHRRLEVQFEEYEHATWLQGQIKMDDERDLWDDIVGGIRTALAGVGAVAAILVVGFWLGYVR